MRSVASSAHRRAMSASTRAACSPEAINKKPHCVLLLDEIEKAHPDIYNILLQVMDHGKLTDNNGRQADFRNVILVMTTNAGAESMQKRSSAFRQSGRAATRWPTSSGCSHRNSATASTESFRSHHFGHEVILKVVDKFLMQLEAQLHEKKVEATFTDALKAWLAEHGFDPQMGARPMARLIQDTIRSALADELLFGRLSNGGRVTIDLDDDDDDKVQLVFEKEEETTTA